MNTNHVNGPTAPIDWDELQAQCNAWEREAALLGLDPDRPRRGNGGAPPNQHTPYIGSVRSVVEPPQVVLTKGPGKSTDSTELPTNPTQVGELVGSDTEDLTEWHHRVTSKATYGITDEWERAAAENKAVREYWEHRDRYRDNPSYRQGHDYAHPPDPEPPVPGTETCGWTPQARWCGRCRDWHTAVDNTPAREPATLATLTDVADWGDPAWHVEGLWPQEAVTLLFGPRKSGKSLTALWLAAQSAVGGTRTLYALGEGRAGLRQRVAALGIPTTAPLEFLLGQSALLGSDCAEATESLATRVRDGGYGAVVVDTLQKYKSPSFDENSSDAVGAAMSFLDSLGVPVLLVGHSGKDSSLGMRGSSAWETDCTAFLRLTRSSDNRLKMLATFRDWSDDVLELETSIVGGVPAVTGTTQWTDAGESDWNRVVAHVGMAAEAGRIYSGAELVELTTTAAEKLGITGLDINRNTGSAQYLDRGWERAAKGKGFVLTTKEAS